MNPSGCVAIGYGSSSGVSVSSQYKLDVNGSINVAGGVYVNGDLDMAGYNINRAYGFSFLSGAFASDPYGDVVFSSGQNFQITGGGELNIGPNAKISFNPGGGFAGLQDVNYSYGNSGDVLTAGGGSSVVWAPVPYVDTTGYWNGTTPTDASTAINRLAAAVYGLLGNSPIP